MHQDLHGISVVLQDLAMWELPGVNNNPAFFIKALGRGRKFPPKILVSTWSRLYRFHPGKHLLRWLDLKSGDNLTVPQPTPANTKWTWRIDPAQVSWLDTSTSANFLPPEDSPVFCSVSMKGHWLILKETLTWKHCPFCNSWHFDNCRHFFSSRSSIERWSPMSIIWFWVPTHTHTHTHTHSSSW